MPALDHATDKETPADNTGWWIMGLLGAAAVVTGAGYVISSRSEHAHANPEGNYPYRLALIDAGGGFTDEYGDKKDYRKLERKAKAWVAKSKFNSAVLFDKETGAKEHFAQDAPWHKPSFGDLNKLKIIFRDKNLQLWGIPYRMRPNSNQQPADIKRAHDEWVPSGPGSYGPKQVSISDWVWLGSPGWWGDMSKERQAQVKEFLAAHGDMVPMNWNEWSEI